MTVPMSWLYRWSATRYHKSWDKREPFRAGCPVISVGNLSVGGTGKSPTVIALTELMWEWYPELRRENSVAILSRGYRRTQKGLVEVKVDSDWETCGDEPLMIKRTLPEAAVVVHEDRTRGAEYATSTLGAQLILLDDGFQHRPIYRDLDLVLLSAEYPFGNGRLLPAGPLREKPEALARAGALLAIGENVDQAMSVAEDIGKPFFHLKQGFSKPDLLETQPDLPTLVVTGIARPSRLYDILEKQQIKVCGALAFSDHHPFMEGDLQAIHETAKQAGAACVLTTAKDRVRMDSWNYHLPVVVPEYGVRFEEPEALRTLLAPYLG